MDYRELLRKYMQLVAVEEGETYIGPDPEVGDEPRNALLQGTGDAFIQEEWDELVRIHRQIK